MAAKKIGAGGAPALNPKLRASGDKLVEVARTIDVSELVLDETFQPRDGVKAEHIRRIQAAITAGEEIEPIDVYLIDDGGETPRPYLVDGWHRLAAHERTGRTQITANVYQGTRADAFLHAGAANIGDSIGLTLAQRQRFARDLLRIPKYFKMSSRRLAPYTGLSKDSIAKYKRQIKEQDVDGVLDGLDPLRPQFIRNGVVIEMNAAGISEATKARGAERAELENTPTPYVEIKETGDGRKVVELLEVLPPTRAGSPGVIVSRSAPQEIPAGVDVKAIAARRDTVDVKAVIDDLELGVVLPDAPDLIKDGVRVRRYDMSRRAWHDLADSRTGGGDVAPLEVVKMPAPDLMFYALACMKRDGWRYRGHMRLAGVVFFAFSSGRGDHVDVQDGENLKDYLGRARARFA